MTTGVSYEVGDIVNTPGNGDANIQLYQPPATIMIDENGGGDPAQSAFISSKPAVSFGPIFSGTF